MQSVKRISEKYTVPANHKPLYTIRKKQVKKKTRCRKATRKWGDFSTPSFFFFFLRVSDGQVKGSVMRKRL